MFQRPVRVKSSTTVKGSDRKKLRREISSIFPGSEQLLSSKCSLTATRLVTHAGSTVTVYVVDGEPLFFDDDGTLFPTVYALWRLPEMLPFVSTWPQVLPRLQGGADLMLPGVVGPEGGGVSVEGVSRGQVCAVNLIGNRSPVGVAVALMSWEVMVANGMRGKGFSVVHLYEDHLWKMGSKLHLPLLPMETAQKHNLDTQEGDGDDPLTVSGNSSSCKEAGDDRTVSVQGQTVSSNVSSCGFTNQGVPENISCDDLVQVCDQRSDSPELAELFTVADLEGGGIATDLSEQMLQFELSEREDDACLRSALASEAVPLGTHTGDLSAGQAVSQQTDTVGSKESEEGEEETVVYEADSSKDVLGPMYPLGEGQDRGGGESGLNLDCQGDRAAEMREEATGVSGATFESDPSNEMDDLLMECFLQALKSRVTKSDLPLLASTFYRSFMLVLCPANKKLDIKKTSYKKLSRFLNAMESHGVIQVEEQSKGVERITNVDFKHPMVKRFSPKLLIEESHDEAGDPSLSTVTTPTSKVLRVTELFMPSHKLLPLFSPAGYTKTSILDHSGVREVVTSYVKSNDLTSKSDPRVVVLDPILSDAVHRKGEPFLAQLTWQQLMERVLEGMRPAHRMDTGSGQPIVRKGRLEPVRLTLAQRTGNKKVTLVDNLDSYLIPPAELAHTVQRIAAASTTVNDVPGRPNARQVLVQGNAVKLLARLLQDHYGLPLKHIEAVDKLKPSVPKKKSAKR